LNGHGDALGGIAVAKDLDYIHKLKFDYMCELGGVMSPFNGWLLLRGIKTLALRMKHHEKNAQALAEYLEPHAQVKSVLFPGLKNFPGHELANKQMTGFGAMLSFEVVGGLQRAAEVVSKLRMAKLAVSLGDCETLVEFPAEMTHRGYRAHELAEFGLTESMLRVSVGLEDAADIIADFDEALS
jgi:methionine-gamma-lyase